ncbi:MAG TPA: family 16 glycoside hydrolase [Chitinophaga sp.]|uniref:family 16 glycoside hydrolase n=1 Tax=Chitinophaga sp. TaxID=1869181 RepID=UPI002DBDBC57|nr:family 16 glycoside hydrolase [Chitinophaga sp.]HEU4553407.1 family 16 glycoside hydrolase [Chitinophaga sp.]
MSVQSFLLYSTLLLSLAACSSGTKEAPPIESLPMDSINLDNLDAFATPANGWQVAGNLYMNRQQPHQVQVKEGKGILVFNGPGNGELSTKWTHGDMDLELDFMLSPDADAAILFQGKYPLQLKDSWLKDSVTAADCGGIEEHAPALNACKAPGLWQHLEVKFKAERTGHGVIDAGFATVILNGRVVQQQPDLAAFAQDTLLKQTKMPGALRLVVNSGPVAFRNIRYKTYSDARASFAGLHYRVYKGVYKNHDTLKLMLPVRSGNTDSLTYRVGDKRAHLLLEGKLQLPVEGHYVFSVRGGGPVRLMIDGNVIADNGGTRDFLRPFYGDTLLKAGPHDFQVSYANYDECLVVEYEGPHIPVTALTTPASERLVEASPQMEYPVKGTAVIQRGFMEHGNEVDPYSMAVGAPGGINYAYDMVTYSPLMAWHGRYIDVAEMWHERGEKQLARPLGAPLQLPGIPCIAELPDKNAAWPDTMRVDSSSYTNRGYKLLPSGLPVFFYTLHQWSVEDYLHPRADGKGLNRDVTVTGSNSGDNAKAWWLLGSGGLIEKLPDGSYAVDDKHYYIETKDKPEIVESKGQYRLVLPLQAGKTMNIHYSITW